MSIFQLALRNLSVRRVSALLTGFTVALGVALAITTGTLKEQIEEKFNQTGSGYELLLGAKGSPLQLVLNTVYHLGNPTGNLSYETYLRYKSSPTVLYAIPIGLGDSYRGFRIFCTTSSFFTAFQYRKDQTLRFKEGRHFNDDEHFQAVIGADVARRLSLQVGASFAATHGIDEGLEELQNVHDHVLFKVVGILEATNSPIDRAIYASLPTIWKLHENEDEDPSQDFPETGEITSIIIKTKAPLFALQLYQRINKEPYAQAAFVVNEIKSLFDVVGNVQWAFMILNWMVIFVSVIGVMMSLYNTIFERRREIAILRALGAHRVTILGMIVLESSAIGFFGALTGFFLSKLVLFLLQDFITLKTGTVIAMTLFNLNEWLIIAGVTLAASLAGVLPGIRAYRTDVSGNLSPTL